MSTIKNVALYEAVFRAAQDRIAKGDAPTRIFHPSEWFGRSISRQHLAPGSPMTRAWANEQVRVRDQHKDQNRFSGNSPIASKSKVGRGGCYFFNSEASGLAESMHYAEIENVLPWDIFSKRVSIPYVLSTKYILQGIFTRSKLVADLSLHGQSKAYVKRFLDEIAGGKVKELLRGKKLEEAISDKEDYSAARAIGHAFESFPYIEGLFVQTARETERQGETGDNLCLFGPDDTIISNIRPDSVLVFPPPWAQRDKVTRVELF